MGGGGERNHPAAAITRSSVPSPVSPPAATQRGRAEGGFPSGGADAVSQRARTSRLSDLKYDSHFQFKV